MNTLARNALSWLRLAVVLAVLSILWTASASAQSSPPSEGLPPLMDEPIVVSSIAGIPTEEETRALLWPALFGEAYVAGRSTVAIGPDSGTGRCEAYLVSPPGSSQMIRHIGTFVLTTGFEAVSWMPDGFASESGTIYGIPYTATETDHTDAVAGFLVTTQGTWSIISASSIRVDATITTANGETYVPLRLLVIAGTYWDATEANQWAHDYATGAIFGGVEVERGNGDHQANPRDCVGYRTCVHDAKLRRIERESNALILKDTQLSALSFRRNVILPAAAGGGGGATAGGLIGLFWGAPGSAIGGLIGGGVGVVGGVIYGVLDHNAEAVRIVKDYERTMATWARAYDQEVATCKETFGNTDGACEE